MEHQARMICLAELVFKTTSDGSASSSERVRITSAGKLNVGGEYDASTYNLQVTGNGGGEAASTGY